MIVPRHPERFQTVGELIQRQGFEYHSFSQGSDSVRKEAQVVLVDQMGVLKKCYQLANLAIVAGSFTKKIGGHNTLEAHVYGIPVICGPYMHSQALFLEAAIDYDAIEQVKLDEVRSKIETLLHDESRMKTLGANGLKMTREISGATEKTASILKMLAPQFFNY